MGSLPAGACTKMVWEDFIFPLFIFRTVDFITLFAGVLSSYGPGEQKPIWCPFMHDGQHLEGSFAILEVHSFCVFKNCYETPDVERNLPDNLVQQHHL